MADFILELLSEEIPSRMQKQASEYLYKEFKQKTEEAGLRYREISASYSIRRLTLIVKDLNLKSIDRIIEKLGPRVDSPDSAIDGFLRSNKISSIDDCNILDDVKGPRYQYIETISAKSAVDLLPVIIEEIIKKFSWIKSMRWGNGNLRWVRPLRNIMALIFEENIIQKLDFEVEGILANDYTYGHRFLKNEKVHIKGIEDYFKVLESNFVLADQAQRRQCISDQISGIEKKYDITVVSDEKLLDEVSGLVEWPVVYFVEFDERFLDLPDEVLQTSMKSHQKYFSVTDKNTKKLTNKFILVSNIQTPNEGKSVISGNQRVLSARLYDAKYFWDRDLAKPLIDNLSSLDNVTYHQKLGSLGEKVKRIESIALELSKTLGLNLENIPTAAKLIKNDLLSEMVGEFPDLQGIMGSYYADLQGYEAEICNAIKDHYMPVSPNDETPKNALSYCLSIADKIDTLACFWSIGETPTGSKDPFALRRAGNGLIRNIIQNRLDLNLSRLIEKILQKSKLIKKQDGDAVSESLTIFLNERFRTYLQDNKFDMRIYDCVANKGHSINYFRTIMLISLLDEFKESKKGLSMLKALKRINNIIEPAKISGSFDQINKRLFTKDVENNLYTGVENLWKKKLISDDITEIENHLNEMCNLTKPINDFFDSIIVNDEDDKLRTNRVCLLNSILDLTSNIFDVNKFEL